ncbi:MAG TPA: DNA ligase-associated DEXH box helicase, partial [Xanthomonadales bacterium]|nr:DNA ligase-associated DEXH box helicase [Xanthomonadales bacterium]
MRRGDLVQATADGLYCPSGDFWIDPWRPVPRALVTHGHGDHARFGMGEYVTAAPGVAILRERLGPDAAIRGVDYGAVLELGRA